MDEMQGVMALPQAQGMGMRPEDMALIEQIRQNVPRQEITQEFLAAGEQADPQAVAEFKQELADLQLTPDELNRLNTMVDAILAAPQDYASLRRAYLAEGIPEDLLPEQFDPAFFAALNMALDTIAMNPGSPAPMAMAMGGVADLAAYGRNGDTMLAHITPQEAAMLKRMGGSGTINPYTGLPEYANIFKKIGKAVKKFAKSTVGKVVIGAALAFFGGPIAAGYLSGAAGSAGLTGVAGFLTSKVGIAAVGGFLAGAGSTLAAGGNLKQALKAGAIGGITGGALQGITGAIQGVNNFAPAPTFGTPGVQAPIDNLSLPAQTAQGVGTVGTAGTATQQAGTDILAKAAVGDLPQFSGVNAPPPQAITYPGSSVGPGLDVSQGTQFASLNPAELPRPSVVAPVQADAAQGGVGSLSAGSVQDVVSNQAPAQIVDRSTVMQPPRAGLIENLTQGNFKEAASQFMPGTIREQGYADAIARAKGILGAEASAADVMKLADKFAPGIVAQYGPIAGAALLGAGALGAFKTTPAEKPEEFKGPTGYQMYFNDPRRFGLYYGGTAPTAYGGMYTSRGYAEGGGVMDTPQAMRVGGKTYPRKIGAINGPGTGTSDSIPAMLSDGEFVFTAKAVRAMGQGSRRKGAKKMYQLMKMLEGKTA
jgi:hypothetical protein